MTDPAAHTPDVDTLVEDAQAALDWLWRLEREDATRRLAVLRYRRSHSATVSAALSDLAATARDKLKSDARIEVELDLRKAAYKRIESLELEVAETRRKWEADVVSFEERVEKLTHERSVACDWAAELAGAKHAAEADRDRAQALADTQEKWAKSEHERADRLARRVAELEAELAHLADMHHRTIRNSRLHDPETIADFRDCPCLPCCRAAAALDGEVLTEEADDPDDAIDDDGMGHQEWRFP